MKGYNQAKRIIDFYPLKRQIVIRKPNSSKILKIDEETLRPEETTRESLTFATNSYNKSFKVDAIYGIIKLVSDSYFIVVNDSSKVAEILDKRIYKVDKFSFIPIKATISSSHRRDNNPNASSVDQKFIDLFLSLFKREGFYYSHDYNITNNLQKQIESGFENIKHDPRFLVNSVFLKQFTQTQVSCFEFFSPFIYGFIEQANGQLMNKGNDLSFTLISRKDINRLGVRFYSRGADLEGNVSNFVETEQIMEFKGKRGYSTEQGFEEKLYSFVQIRGSIPVIWNQLPTLKYTPTVNIHQNGKRHEQTFRLHFQKLTETYNQIQIVNLIDKKKDQFRIGDKFSKLHQKVKDENYDHYGEKVDYEWFDYHYECRKMKVENLSKLLTSIKDKLNSMGWFECSYVKRVFEGKEKNDQCYEFKILVKQSGVIRTNCMDNLDRTNVVQSVFGRQNILSILRRRGIKFLSNDVFCPLPGGFEQHFRNIWTDNADQLSILYSGTPALKTDFTRTGKRSYIGMFWDGYHSVKRYVINQIIDSETQNIFDFMSGRLMVSDYPNYSSNKGGLKRTTFFENVYRNFASANFI